MLIRSCFRCKSHEVRQGDDEETSHCSKENCWSRFSKCVARKALDRFLDDEGTSSFRTVSASNRVNELMSE